MECDEKIGARIRQFMDDCNTFYEQGQLSKARDSLFEAWGILPVSYTHLTLPTT